MPAAMSEPFAPSEADVLVAKQTGARLSRIAMPGKSLRMTAQNGAAAKPTEVIEIPAGAVALIQNILAAMAQGQAVSIVPVNAELTTQQAANLLGVSRPFVIKLLTEKTLGHRKVGRHRRIVLQDLLDYKRRINAERQKVLDELAAEGQRLGVGY